VKERKETPFRNRTSVSEHASADRNDSSDSTNVCCNQSLPPRERGSKPARRRHPAGPHRVVGSGAARVGAAQEIIGLADGTKTALSAMMLTGMSVWPSLDGKRLQWAGDSTDAFFGERAGPDSPPEMTHQRASQGLGLVPSVA
jgi:hypothetical protein